MDGVDPACCSLCGYQGSGCGVLEGSVRRTMEASEINEEKGIRKQLREDAQASEIKLGKRQ